jgi:hypothetical protein
MEDAAIYVAIFCPYVYAPAVLVQLQERLPVPFAMAFYGPRDEQRVLTAKLTRAECTQALAVIAPLGMQGLILDIQVYQGEEMPQELLPPGHPDDPDLPSSSYSGTHFRFRGSSNS